MYKFNKKPLLFLILIFSPFLVSAQGNLSSEIQVPWFGQLDKAWGAENLGDSRTINIADNGCALTSTAMVLRFFDVNTDPKKLNKWLLIHNGYDEGWDDESGNYLGKVRMIWEVVASGHTEVSSFRRYDFTALPADLYLIRGYLDGGIPVIAEVLRPGGIPHFVVLTGYKGDDFLIRDPLDRNVQYLSEAYRISDSHGSGAARNIFGIRIFTPAD